MATIFWEIIISMQLARNFGYGIAHLPVQTVRVEVGRQDSLWRWECLGNYPWWEIAWYCSFAFGNPGFSGRKSYYSFVCLQISPCCLVLKLKIQKNIYLTLNEARRANNLFVSKQMNF